jgi:hypothetical protein
MELGFIFSQTQLMFMKFLETLSYREHTNQAFRNVNFWGGGMSL